MMASHRWEASCCSSRLDLLGATPRQQRVKTVDGVVGDLRQHMAQPGGGDPVQLGRANQRLHGGRTFATAVGANEQVVPLGGRLPFFASKTEECSQVAAVRNL